MKRIFAEKWRFQQKAEIIFFLSQC